MKELVETIAKALVDSPDEVVVTESETERESREELQKQSVLLLRQQLQNAIRK